MTLPEFLTAANRTGALSTADEAWTAAALAPAPDQPRTPWYFHVLIAIGAWIASLMILGFFSAVFLQMLWKNSFISGSIGLLLIAGAIVVFRARSGHFLRQSTLACSVAGHILVLMAAGRATDSFGGVVLGAFALAALLYVPTSDSLHRFLSTATALGLSTVWLVLKMNDVIFGGQPQLSAFRLGQFGSWLSALLHLALLAWVFLPARPRRMLRPFGYALAVSLIGLLLPFAIPYLLKNYAPHWPLSIVLGLSLLGAVAWAAGGVHRLRTHPAAFVSIFVAVLLLTLAANPSILAALALLVIGFGLQDRVLLWLGALSLPAFLFCHYYSLQMDLQHKSWLLLATGAVLFALRAVLNRVPWGQEENPAP